MNNRNSMEWTDEKEQELKQLIDKGFTTLELAIRMGTSTRAINAKRARLGLYSKPHLRGNSFDWTEERQNELRKLVALKMPNADIAERFGISKNAIIGKRSRLGLSESNTRTVRNVRRVSKHKAPPKPAENQQSALRDPEEPAGPVSLSGGCFHPEHPESSPVDAPGPHVAPLGHHSSCQYPFGSAKGGDLTWCEDPVQSGSSYCEEHHKLCHAPTRTSPIKSAGITRWR